jgi:hypothetical protein
VAEIAEFQTEALPAIRLIISTSAGDRVGTPRHDGRAGPPFLCGRELGRLQRPIVPAQRPLGEEDLSAERCVRLHDVHHALIRFLTAPILL